MQKLREPSVTIIVLNYNGVIDTIECIKKLLKIRYSNYMVVVVDNGSKTNEAKILSNTLKDKRLVIIRNKKNYGFAGGNNRIIKSSKSQYVLLLNNDAFPDKNFLKEMVSIMEKDRNIAATQAKILSYYYPKYFDYAGGAGGYLDKLGYPYARGRIGFHLEKDVGQYDSQVSLVWASGACFLLRNNLLKKSGLLSEDFFFYHEETDLCLRLKRLGYSISYAPKAVVYHKSSGSSSKSTFSKKIFYIHRNNLLLISRNFSLFNLLWIFPLRIILDWCSSFFYIFTGRPSFVIAIFAAHASFLTKISGIYKFRKKSKTKLNPIENSFAPFCVFWEYFIRGKHRYTELFGGKSLTPTISYVKIISNVLNKVDI